MKLLDRLPYSATTRRLLVADQSVLVRSYQIIVWVSVGIREQFRWDARMPRFPAILDTGNNHHFAIGSGQLMLWAGIQTRLLQRNSAIRERGERIPLYAATHWLHANHTGSLEAQTNREPRRLQIDEGIAVYPDERAPRLPVLGLRVLTANSLYTTLDGERLDLSMHSPGWRTRLMRLLS